MNNIISRSRKSSLVALPIVMGALIAAIGASPVQAATSATSTATLTMDNFASVATSGAISITPLQADFEAGFIEQSGAVTLTVVTNDSTGCTVSVNGSATPSLKNEDLLIKSATAGTATAYADYAATPSASTALWSTASAKPNGTAVTLDVKVQNLKTYAGGSAGAGSTATYSNTLTFNVLPNS
ncbi:MAG TPA: hypothetical protein VF681_03495 [Abditibacteriaceae bacterium]|jgi:hypothetical protein